MLLKIGALTGSGGSGGDTTPPTITSADTASVDENATLAHALTANEDVTWSIVGGVDQAQFEISGSTLRWASNGTQDYEDPQDDDTDNDYVVQVRATSTGSGRTTNQTITVTVDDVAEFSLSSFKLFLDPSDITTMWEERTGASATTQSSVDGVVGTMLNKGTVGGYFTAAADTRRPILRQTGALFYLEFDGVDDYLAGAAASNFWAVADAALCLSGRNTNNGDALAGDNGTILYLRNHTTSGNSAEMQNWDGGPDLAAASYTYNTDAVFLGKHTGGAVTLQINNGTEASTASGNSTSLAAAMEVGRVNSDALCASSRVYGLVADNNFGGQDAEVKTAIGALAGLSV